MRAVRNMTVEEQDFAEQNHDLVFRFLRFKHLPMEEFYDVVVFGYLAAVQEYLRKPTDRVKFQTVANRNMKDALSRDKLYNARAVRSGIVDSLDELGPECYEAIPDPKQDIARQVENRAILKQAAKVATPKEAPIVALLADGFTLSEAARRLRISSQTAGVRMRSFYRRARAAIG